MSQDDELDFQQDDDGWPHFLEGDEGWPSPNIKAQKERFERCFEAIRHGDLAAIRGSFAQHPDDGRVGSDASLLLEAAIDHRQPEILRALIELGVEVNEISELGGTVLMHAAWEGDRESLRILLEAGADPDILSEQHDRKADLERPGQCALAFAMYQGHLDVVRILRPATAPEVRALARQAALKRVQDDAEDEGDPDFVSLIDSTLLRAVQLGLIDEIRPALDSGANPHKPIPAGATPPGHPVGCSAVGLAASMGRVDALKILLESVADVNAPADALGETPLAIAVRSNQDSAIAMLLEAGANPGTRDLEGRTAWEIGRQPLSRSGGEALERCWRKLRGSEPDG